MSGQFPHNHQTSSEKLGRPEGVAGRFVTLAVTSCVNAKSVRGNDRPVPVG
jgi:hypothetical protein